MTDLSQGISTSLGLNSGELAPYRNLLFAAKLIVEGFYAGKHRSTHHDFSSEFTDYRSYSPGDDPRAIDWRAVARSDKLTTRLFRKETDMSATLVLDTSASMDYRGSEGPSKHRHAVLLAAAIGFLMVRQGDRPGYAWGASKLEGYLPPVGSLRGLNQSLARVWSAAPAAASDLSALLRGLGPSVRRRGLLVVVSDFLDPLDEVLKALAIFRLRGLRVLLFQVLTDEELSLPAGLGDRFKDPETELCFPAEGLDGRETYRNALQAHLRSLQVGARAAGFGYHLVRTSEPYHAALSRYLSSRAG